MKRDNHYKHIITNHAIIRNKVDKLEDDRLLKDDINAMIKLVNERAFRVN